ncbi:hypothetical protein Acsp06_25200 [Actinomycetospora sp. NBRC 106375]|uniref:DUF4333 domain-containing protein n=1 Tax=Actinomycetospora sp. NBRC 106375 TaxID=3032207 RepID=UPI0024A4A4C5|nr:DUF4333 domain-containing protein [Actinomycetospora sp. NBRC 106375]GLZ46335.1 hypothetical protein Acsp06_25200 [Actinomycetospora sp. NBRC 106375]
MSQQAPPPPYGYPHPPVPQGPAGLPSGPPPPAPGYGGYAPPPPRKSQVGKIVAIVVGAVAVLFVGLLVLGALAGPRQVSTQQIEQQITEQYQQQYGYDASQVRCPSSLDAEVGATTTCSGPIDGTPTTLLVKVTSVQDGTVNFDITPQ